MIEFPTLFASWLCLPVTGILFVIVLNKTILRKKQNLLRVAGVNNNMHVMRSAFYLLLCLIIASFATYAQATLEVTITGVKPGKGNIRVGLFEKDNFLKAPVDGKETRADGTSVVVRFENVRNGNYAVSVIHDANENGDLDKTKLGIPKEGFAFSNNAMGKKGPPSFDKAQFEVSGASLIRQELTMRYP